MFESGNELRPLGVLIGLGSLSTQKYKELNR